MAGRKRKPEKIRRPTLKQFRDLVASVSNLRDRAFICFLYLTGARISEVVRQVRRFQVEFEKIEGKSFIMVHNVITLKRRKEIYRDIPIPVNDFETPFLEPLIAYLNTVPSNMFLFDFTRINGYRIVREKTYLFPHYFRHLRLTHLVTEYNFSERDLTFFTGWADGRQATVYTHLDLRDIARKLTK